MATWYDRNVGDDIATPEEVEVLHKVYPWSAHSKFGEAIDALIERIGEKPQGYAMVAEGRVWDYVENYDWGHLRYTVYLDNIFRHFTYGVIYWAYEPERKLLIHRGEVAGKGILIREVGS